MQPYSLTAQLVILQIVKMRTAQEIIDDIDKTRDHDELIKLMQEAEKIRNEMFGSDYIEYDNASDIAWSKMRGRGWQTVFR